MMWGRRDQKDLQAQQDEAEVALKASQHQLRIIRLLAPIVDRQMERISVYNVENNFAVKLEQAYIEGVHRDR